MRVWKNAYNAPYYDKLRGGSKWKRWGGNWYNAVDIEQRHTSDPMECGRKGEGKRCWKMAAPLL